MSPILHRKDFTCQSLRCCHRNTAGFRLLPVRTFDKSRFFKTGRFAV